MDVFSLFIPNSEPPVVAKPCQGPFDDPTVASQFFAGVDTLSGNSDLDPAFGEGRSASWNAVSLVSMKLHGTLSRTTSGTPNRMDSIDQLLENGRVVGIGSGETECQRRAASIDYKMALRARLSAIYRVWAGSKLPFFPTPMAGIDCESTEARDQSIWSARPNRPRRTWWSRSHTPASCQSRSRRQQVIPQPQPISWGSISQGIPLLRTNKIPVSAARSGTRGRPPFGFGGSGGRSGSIASHRSSGKRGLAISSEVGSKSQLDSRHRNMFC